MRGCVEWYAHLCGLCVHKSGQWCVHGWGLGVHLGSMVKLKLIMAECVGTNGLGAFSYVRLFIPGTWFGPFTTKVNCSRNMFYTMVLYTN